MIPEGSNQIRPESDVLQKPNVIFLSKSGMKERGQNRKKLF